VKINNELKNRCGIFLFYDPEGKVDQYVLDMLDDLRKSISYMLVVCNGKPLDESVEKLKKHSDEVLIRSNTGFDVGGYREGLFHVGFNKLSEYDEVVLFNYTFYCGWYSFTEMFEKMSEKDLDFWGITKHHKIDYDPYNKIKYGYMPEHIQSHFIVVRNSLVSSDDYKNFMISMKNPESYVESICDYETIFTKNFEDLGYKWDVYVNTDRYEKYAYCPIMFYPKELVEEDRCPILKRRSFFTDYKDFLINTSGEVSSKVYEYLETNTDYNMDLIWDNLLRLENIYSVYKAMNLNYILPEDVAFEEDFTYNAAICIWVKSTESLAFYEEYLKEIGSEIKITLYGDKNSTDEVIKLLNENNNIYAINEEISSYQEFITLVSKNEKTDQEICFTVIDSVEKIRPYSNVLSEVYKNFKCTIASLDYIKNVLITFKENNKMGLAVPPFPNFGEYFSKYANVSAPIAPVGGSFWLRAEVLNSEEFKNSLLTKMEDEEFLLNLPNIVKKTKYYTAVLYSEGYAAIETTNSDYMMRELNKAVFDKYGANYHDVVLDRVKNNILERDVIVMPNNWKAKVKHKLKRILPRSLYLKGKKVYFRIKGRKFEG